jgi:NTE family protein
MGELLGGPLTFADLRLPFAAVATDVRRARRAVLAEGDVADAVMASAALPIVTRPVDIPAGRFLDGGFADPAPVDVARSLGADVVAVIHVGTAMGGQSDTDNPVLATLRGFEIGLQHFVEVRLAQADLVVAPRFREGISWLSFDHAEELVAAGHDAMTEQLPALKDLL